MEESKNNGGNGKSHQNPIPSTGLIVEVKQYLDSQNRRVTMLVPVDGTEVQFVGQANFTHPTLQGQIQEVTFRILECKTVQEAYAKFDVTVKIAHGEWRAEIEKPKIAIAGNVPPSQFKPRRRFL